jgi:hypothetical protein
VDERNFRSFDDRCGRIEPIGYREPNRRNHFCDQEISDGFAMKTWIITAALGIALSAAGALAAFAQAGSTGGTLGNTDKSISGEREQPRHSENHEKRKSAAPHASSNCKLASVWANEMSGVGGGSSIWTISSDGSAVEKGLCNATGHASLAGRTLTIRWHNSCNDGVYTVQLNESCTAGSGKAAIVAGMLSGDVRTVTFSRVGD